MSSQFHYYFSILQLGILVIKNCTKCQNQKTTSNPHDNSCVTKTYKISCYFSVYFKFQRQFIKPIQSTQHSQVLRDLVSCRSIQETKVKWNLLVVGTVQNCCTGLKLLCIVRWTKSSQHMLVNANSNIGNQSTLFLN